jgi:hypothetical protein
MCPHSAICAFRRAEARGGKRGENVIEEGKWGNHVRDSKMGEKGVTRRTRRIWRGKKAEAR